MKLSRLEPLAALMALIFFGELGLRYFEISTNLLPLPSQVLHSLIENRVEFWEAFSSTAICALTGWALAALIGFIFAVIFSLSSHAQKALYPIAVFFQTVPIVAIAPLLVIWLGFGVPTIVSASAIVAFFPILAATTAGLVSPQAEHMELFHSLTASRWQIFVKLRLPSALPQIFTGLRVSAGLSVIGTIVGEFIGGGGLGTFIESARNQQRIDQVFGAIILSTFLGWLFLTLINIVSHWALSPWHSEDRT
jgi:NitT/TauT family transport system permease protein